VSGLRVVFMGTPEFACPALQKLIDRGEQVVAVVTIPVYQPLKVRDPDFIEFLRQLNPDVIVVVAFGQILPKSLLDIPPLGCINVHASLLPRYRGAAPLNWCIINGENETGVTTMLMDVGLDTGPMLLKQSTPVDGNEDIVSLHDRMSVMGAVLLSETLDGLAAGTILPQEQDGSQSCYAPMLKKEDGRINWHRDARSIHNQVRGLAAWPVAFSYLDGQVLKVYRTRVAEGNGLPGTVLQADKRGIEVACLKGSLIIEELQLAGKKRLDAASFLAGYAIPVGALFSAGHDGGAQA
jgi:methionyl-tRNA formyltransferase